MWPWDWVIAAGNGISGIAQKIYDWVTQQIAALTSWVTSAISDIWNAISRIYQDIANVWNEVVRFVVNLVAMAEAWVENTVNGILRWTGEQFLHLVNSINDFIQWVEQSIGRLTNQLVGYIQGVVRWVHDEVWVPLVRAISDVRSFVTTWIPRIWQYIQHPELLVKLIAGDLLGFWQRYVMRYGTAIARWMLRKMMGMAGEVFDLLETILSAII